MPRRAWSFINPDSSAWTALNVVTSDGQDSYDDEYQMVTSLYRLNDNNSEGDWYMVNKTFSSSPGSGYCTFSRANVTQALYPAENYFAESTKRSSIRNRPALYTVRPPVSRSGRAWSGEHSDRGGKLQRVVEQLWGQTSAISLLLWRATTPNGWNHLPTPSRPAPRRRIQVTTRTILTMPQGTPPFNVVTAEDNVSNVKCGDLGGKTCSGRRQYW